MAIDRPGDEGVEEQRAVDTPPPPPPPDRPGEEGFPSRAESRAAATAAFERIRERDHAEEKTDTSAPDAINVDWDDAQDDRPEASTDRERDAVNDDVDAPTESDHESVDEKRANAEGSDPANGDAAVRPGDTTDSADGQERVPVFEWQTEDGRLARAYLDTLQPRADDLPDEIGPETPDPTDRLTTRIIDESENKGSLLERLRGQYYDVIDDFNDTIKSESNRFKDLFDRQPAGSHTVDRPLDHAVIDTPHHGVNTGEAVTAVLTTGIFIGELFYRAVHDRMRRTKEDDDARD